MANYDVRVNGPTLGGCTKDAYLGGGVRNYAGKRETAELPSYLADIDAQKREQTNNAYIERPLEMKLEGLPSYLSKPISKGLPMINSVGSCRGTCRTEQGCTCK